VQQIEIQGFGKNILHIYYKKTVYNIIYLLHKNSKWCACHVGYSVTNVMNRLSVTCDCWRCDSGVRYRKAWWDV